MNIQTLADMVFSTQGKMLSLIRSIVVNRIWWLWLWITYAAIAGFFLVAALAESRQHNIELATTGARNVFQILVTMRQWNAERGGVYAPVGPNTQPNPYLKHPQRDIHATNGMALTLINPAFMTRMMSDMTPQEKGLSFRSVSNKPLNPNNSPDQWEAVALALIANGTKEVAELATSPQGKPVFRYLAPLWVKEDCLMCHKEQGYKLGDLRGGISITQDYQPFLDAAAPSERTSILAHIGVLLLLIVASGMSLELLRRSWMKLEDNINELTRTRNELLQSEKMASLGRLVAGFAHEINTPVGVALGAISHSDDTLTQVDRMLEHEEVDETTLRDRLEELRTGGALAMANLRRAASMVQRLKRSSVDQTSEQQRVFGVRELIEDVAFSLKGQLRKGPIEVTVACPEAIRIDGTPGHYEQLLTNLLMNSIQHGFADGTRPGNISIQVTSPSPTLLRIDYTDSGAGMAGDTAERIFEPFFTTRRGTGGTGLGMFLCYNIVTVDLHGEIHCNSAPGEGVHFTITLPCKRADMESST